MRTITAFFTALLLVTAAAPARGQDAPSTGSETFISTDDHGTLLELRVLSNDELAQLRDWMSEAKDYQKWRARWFNRYKRNLYGRPAARRQAPLPPDWMGEQCRVLAFYDPRPAGELRDACDLEASLHALQQEEPATLQARYTQAQREDEPHASFWDRIYFDGLWPMVNSGSSVFGVAGLHTGFWSLGRVSPFTLPGVMLVSVPDNRGGRIIKPAATFGLSIEWFDFDFMGRRTKLHFTIAKAFIASGSATRGVNSVDLAGFSLTTAKEK